MKNLFNKVGDSIRGLDIYGVPVQLTYKGQTNFNTVFGGLVSILVALVLAIFFVETLYEEYSWPQFQTLPVTFDVRDKKTYLNPALGNTIAVGHDSDLADLRVNFFAKPDDVQPYQYLEGVYCTDLYAEQIEAEKNGTVSTKYFTETFLDSLEVNRGYKWICPNITDLLVSPAPLWADVVTCRKGYNNTYAGDASCTTDTGDYYGSPTVWLKIVSTNLYADTYYHEGQLQLQSETVHSGPISYRKTVTQYPKVVENRRNIFKDNFWLSTDTQSTVNTTNMFLNTNDDETTSTVGSFYKA